MGEMDEEGLKMNDLEEERRDKSLLIIYQSWIIIN